MPFQKIKFWRYQSALKKIIALNRSKRNAFKGTNPAKTALILFNGTDQKVVDHFRKLHRELEQLGIRPKMMAFVDSPVDVHDFGMAMYNTTSIRWDMKPKPKLIELVQTRDFDLLFLINPEELTHLHFLAVAANARFKISTLTSLPNDFNLTVKTQEDLSIPNIFDQMKNCLDTLSI
jgi:hypothetical protein